MFLLTKKFLVKLIQRQTLNCLTASPEETERVDTDNIQTEVPAENDSEIENKSSPTSSLEKTDEIVDIDHIKTKDPDETNPEIDKTSFPTANDEKVT